MGENTFIFSRVRSYQVALLLRSLLGILILATFLLKTAVSFGMQSTVHISPVVWNDSGDAAIFYGLLGVDDVLAGRLLCHHRLAPLQRLLARKPAGHRPGLAGAWAGAWNCLDGQLMAKGNEKTCGLNGGALPFCRSAGR